MKNINVDNIEESQEVKFSNDDCNTQNSPINPREAITAFACWLTGIKKPITISKAHSVYHIIELADKFCTANGFSDLKKDWEEQFEYPE